MAVSELKGAEELISFLKKYGNTPAKLQVLFFWGRHPRGRFTIDCIADALDARRLYLKDAIETLVTEGIVEKQQNNGITLYFISQCYRSYAEAITRLEWSEIKCWADYPRKL